MAMTEAYVLGGVRTPFTRYGGTLSGIRADDLLGMTMKGACDRLGVPLGAVEDIVAGCVNPAHEGMGDVARWAALAAGFPDTAAGATVNRSCVVAIRLAASLTRGVCRVPEIDSRWWK
jgi:3-oxo-5,6-didehydrosuberyl-CoA/3-oxoadipyl-CoA thiolase